MGILINGENWSVVYVFVYLCLTFNHICYADPNDDHIFRVG